MRFIFNKGTIIFVVCSIVSLIPLSLGSVIIVYANTFTDVTGSLPGLFTLGGSILYMTPIFIFLMGDFLFYHMFIKHQEIPAKEKVQAIIGFFLAFIVIYIFYFLTIDMVAGFLHVLTKA